MTKHEEILRNITPKNDIVFKKIFGAKGNEGILKDFLESILDIKIESLKVELGTELIPDFYNGKVSKLDVKTVLKDNTIVNIEIQTNMQDYSEKRNLVYWSKLYLSQFERGNKYEKANKTICIWILDGEVYDFNKYHSKWKITEEDIGKTISFDDFEIHIIELKKFRKLDIIKPMKKDFWLWFIDYTEKELVEMSSYNVEEVKKAKEEYDRLMADETMRYLLIQEQIAEWDENSRIANAEKRGENKAKEETAKKMLELGLEIETIEKATGLTREEIEKLK